MAPKKGYWRASNSSDNFYACPLSSACLGGEISSGKILENGSWDTGYEGNKC